MLRHAGNAQDADQAEKLVRSESHLSVSGVIYDQFMSRYSYRSATIGSTLAARLAGMAQAANETLISNTDT
jgi:hypothetical protein